MNAFAGIRIHSARAGILPAVGAVLFLPGLLAAQAEASTLEVLTRKAPLVLEVECGNPEVRGGFLRMPFRVIETIRGRLSAPPVFLEPASGTGRVCGGALAGLRKGDRLLAFLLERPRGPLPIGGARGLLPAKSAEARAARLLLSVKDPDSRIRLVLRQCGSDSPRVRADAAFALPSMPGWEKAGPDLRARLRAACGRMLRRRGDRVLGLSLLQALARSEPVQAANLSWTLLLSEKDRDLHAPLRAWMLRALPASVVLGAFRAPPPAAREARRRAATLLRALPSPSGVRLARRLLGKDAAPSVPPRDRKARFRAIFPKARSRRP